MSNLEFSVLLYQKDFSEKGADKYWIYNDGVFSEISWQELVSLDCTIVTHDYWLISNSLFKNSKKLPKNIVDVVLFSKQLIGKKSNNESTQLWDISKTIKPLFNDVSDFNKYIDIYYKRSEFDFDTYMLFAHKLAEYYENLCIEARSLGEEKRYFEVEVPVYSLLSEAVNRGIKVSNETLRKHKDNIELDYFRALKDFSEIHEVFYEIPPDKAIFEKFKLLGYEVDNYSIESILRYLPTRENYARDLVSLRKIYKAYGVFSAISVQAERIMPIVEPNLTSTSRIYYKSPTLQNISKKYRDIFIPDHGMELGYVDYDQFEVGVMAALSSDPKLIDVYENEDVYSELAVQVFGDPSKRKLAKTIFLSYAYGMSLDNILRSVDLNSGNKEKVQEFIQSFNVCDKWKETVYEQFFKEGKVSTICGNHLIRVGEGELKDKEKRSSVNHVVQGSAAFIFKKALLELSKLEGVQILIPMHDAVLFQYEKGVDPKVAVDVFEGVMSSELGGIKGRASLEQFYVVNA